MAVRRPVAPLKLNHPPVLRIDRQRLEGRLKTDTYDTFYRHVFVDLERDVVQVLYKTLGEFNGRVVAYVFAYDTSTARVPINQLFYRSTGTSRDAGFEGIWFPMLRFDVEPFARVGYRIRKMEDYYLDDPRHLDAYLQGVKQHPDDDIGAYGRYLRRDLAAVGAWLWTHWTRPAVVEPLDPHVCNYDYADA